TRITSIGNRIPLVASIAFHTRRKKELSINEQAVRPPMRQNLFHTWIGCESAQAKALRTYLLTECLANPKWIRASGYWRKGSAATHDSYDA
ncbi:SIP domain-containing protein, partial [Polaromonas hydrogenivorans]